MLEVNNLRKKYSVMSEEFFVKDISFQLTKGKVTALIGSNGSGKSTIINSIIGTRKRDSGTVSFFGEKVSERDIDYKQNIGVVFDEMLFPPNLNVNQLNKVFKQIYRNWNQDLFFQHLNDFNLPRRKQVKTFSRGMSMKLSMTVALSHGSKILILDEATAGIDVTGREDVFNILQNFIKKNNGSVLITSHISEEIDHLADFLIFIKHGRTVLEVTKNDLFNNYSTFAPRKTAYIQ